jgi:hypothetical protein
MHRAATLDILRRLAASGVDFVVVGMAAGVLRGAPLTTVDLHVVHSRAGDNVARLLAVLRELDAVYRHDPRRLRPQESHLSGPGHQLLTTSLGDLDCLGSIGSGLTYLELLPRSGPMQLEPGLAVHVIDLPTLIELKQAAGRPKDLAVLPVLHATLAEVRRRSEG